MNKTQEKQMAELKETLHHLEKSIKILKSFGLPRSQVSNLEDAVRTVQNTINKESLWVPKKKQV